MVERIGEDNVFVHLDTYHMNIEEKGFDEAIVEAGRHLRYINLSESDRGVPGNGTVEWASVFRGLARIGYAGDMVVASFLNLLPDLLRTVAVLPPDPPGPAKLVHTGLPFLPHLA